MPLKNRHCQIPNNLRFYCPILKWTSPNGASFRVICEGYAQAVRANIALAKQKGLPITMTEIENAVDAYNTAICVQNGWDRFITGGAVQPAPFRNHPPSVRNPNPPRRGAIASAKAVVAGSRIVIEWLASGAEAVPQEQANSRAAVCAKCPLNSKEELSSFFTVPVAVAIKTALETRKGWNLSTPSDDQLGTCTACDCVLKLKSHMVFSAFYPKMSQATKDALDPACWIRKEAAEVSSQ